MQQVLEAAELALMQSEDSFSLRVEQFIQQESFDKIRSQGVAAAKLALNLKTRQLELLKRNYESSVRVLEDAKIRLERSLEVSIGTSLERTLMSAPKLISPDWYEISPALILFLAGCLPSTQLV